MIPGIISAVHGGFGGPATVSFVGSTASTTDTNSYTFTNHATGTAGNRYTIVGVSSRDDANDFTITGVTVGGVAATLVADNAADKASTSIQSAVYIIDNPSGTTATIVVTASESITSCAVSVWAAYDLQTPVARSTDADLVTSGTNSMSFNVPTDGFGIGVGTCNADVSCVWTGMTEQADATLDTSGGSQARYSAADTTTVGTPLAVDVDFSGSQHQAVVCASFR